MKIASIEAIAIDLPMRRPMKMAGVVINKAENVLVKMVSECGVVGWGEAASAPTMTGETVESICCAVRLLTASLCGAELDLAFLGARMKSCLYGNSSAKAAIDMAAYDLVGRKSKKPVHELLGRPVRDSVQVLWLLGTGSKESDLAEAQAKYDEGIRAFKVKVGNVTVDQDIERTRAVRSRLPADAWLCADANQAWSVEDASRYLNGTGDCLEFLEQPLSGEDLAGMARVTAASNIPIGIDEGLHCLADLMHHEAAAAAIGGSLKAIKLGGIDQVLRAGLWCAGHGWKVNLACKIAESGISSAAILQLGAVLPTIDWGVSLSNQYLEDDIIAKPLQIRNGRASIPTSPGLGIEVDEDRIEHYRRRTS